MKLRLVIYNTFRKYYGIFFVHKCVHIEEISITNLYEIQNYHYNFLE